ncbi:alpha/beta hydrolase [Exilibacterium tricleocarpae]|uniref:Proline iminopeptidase n=2 Tax=Exilibacterium tricleocarpae TaxID=2591008 RepID=A0A545U8G9_9GAMM|nr:alpha/beta hydrolase [Exilibacterium tricleocarpae]
MKVMLTLPAALLMLACTTVEPRGPKLLAGETEYIFTAASGESVAALRGAIAVPERRDNPHSRMIPLTYVRFPATGKRPGAPIVYLSGGPGGSGIATARRNRFPLFMAMREFGDVIALDQRGTGASNVLPACRSSRVIPVDRPLSDRRYIGLHRDALRECLVFWEDHDIDLKGYNTLESVSDLDALRRHLGARKLTLWGISYGSHLALAALKQMDTSLERVILASAEGLHQTIKLPARTDAYFERLQQAVDTQPEARLAYPDIKALIRRVHARLELSPAELEITYPDGSVAEYLLQRRDMQRTASALIADPQRAARLLSLYAAVDRGDLQPIARLLSRWHRPGEPVAYQPMSEAMDIASGIGAERRARVYQQAESALLGTYLNATLHLLDAAPLLDLGDSFRKQPESGVPVLLFSGTLDGRTYLESQREAVVGLTNLTAVTVVNAGHNLFMSSPAVKEAMADFMRGRPVATRQITVPLPELLVP